eukprot:UC1_evm1s1367
MPLDEVEQLSDDKEALFRELAVGQLKPLPGLVNLFEWADANDIERVMVTNAPRENVDFMMEAAGLTHFWPEAKQVLADDCAHAKPHPEPY